MNYTNKFLINGPANVIRLEGKVGKKKKMIYIFGDLHYNIANQTKCSNDININIDQLFPLIFKENKKMKYDFFVEHHKADRERDINLKWRDLKYIENIVEFFVENFKEVVNSKVKTSKKYKNTRFHYFDIRKEHFELFANEYFSLEDYLKKLSGYYTIYKEDLFKLQKLLIQFVKILYDVIFKIQKSDIRDMIKLRNKYHNRVIGDNIKFILKNIIKTIKQLIKKLVIHTNSIKKLIKDYEKNKLLNIYDITLKYNKLFSDITRTINYSFNRLTYITDLFFIRRFLDKNYIKNSIIYCGLMHCHHIAYVLVKYFNFKITHIHYKDNKLTLKKLMDKLKKVKYDNNSVHNLNILFGGLNLNSENDIFYQCVDMSKFPKNLT